MVKVLAYYRVFYHGSIVPWIRSNEPSTLFSSKHEKTTWKLANPEIQSFPFTDAVSNMVATVETMSGGEFQIKIDAVNKHKSALAL